MSRQNLLYMLHHRVFRRPVVPNTRHIRSPLLKASTFRSRFVLRFNIHKDPSLHERKGDKENEKEREGRSKGEGGRGKKKNPV